ncbi:MAG: LysR family transcriptional regulator [Pseudomonadota bacterium]
MDWDGLRCFVIVAELGTLSRAAGRLGVGVATVARRLDALERGLGFRLVDRSPVGIRLTRAGRELLPLARTGAERIQDVERIAAVLRQGDGEAPVRVSTTEPVAAEVLAPATGELLRREPRIRLDLRSTSDVQSLAMGDTDIAVRLFRPEGQSLVIQRLPAASFSLYVSRDYLAGRSPQRLDLKRERLISFDDSYGPIPERAWIDQYELGGRVVMRSSSTRAILAAVKAGIGIALLPDFQAARESDLVAIRDPRPVIPRAVWLAVHRDQRNVHAIRVVRDWIAETVARTVRSGRRAPASRAS